MSVISIDIEAGGLDTAFEHPSFSDFLAKLLRNVPKDTPIYTTGVDLWDSYIRAFPKGERQEYRCNCCKDFIRRYGSLVYLGKAGRTHSILWDNKSDYGYFTNVVRALYARMSSVDTITGVFCSDEKDMGVLYQGGWDHFHMNTPAICMNTSHKTASQVMAESREDFRMLSTAVNKYSIKVITKAIAMLESGDLNNPNAVIGHARWFRDLKQTISKARGYRIRDGITWDAVAKAPAGFTHVSGNAIGALMDDIVATKPPREIIRRFNSMMAPLQYHRPQKDAKAGNIKQAEKLIATLGLERSLERRFARLPDLKLIWTPRDTQGAQAGSGIFGHLTPRGSDSEPEYRNGVTRITLARFLNKVLPEATRIQAYVPNRSTTFTALTTAVHGDAPGILQWSNHVAWYVYPGGTTASSWHLTPGYVDVTGITPQPNMWNDECPHVGEGATFILDGCYDSRQPGAALFPAILRNDLHEVRATIEQFSREGNLHGRGPGNACGIRYNGSTEFRVRVTSNGVVSDYMVDRLD